jgi:hypothetical protein
MALPFDPGSVYSRIKPVAVFPEPAQRIAHGIAYAVEARPDTPDNICNRQMSAVGVGRAMVLRLL